MATLFLEFLELTTFSGTVSQNCEHNQDQHRYKNRNDRDFYHQYKKANQCHELLEQGNYHDDESEYASDSAKNLEYSQHDDSVYED